MFAEIITIGDEILIGQIVDTNSAHIATELNKIGVQVLQITTVQDEEKHILEALANAEKRADLVIITGGLGPTKDDITKQTLCAFFEDSLVLNQTALQHIHYLFKEHIKRKPSALNEQQAMLPSRAEALQNKFGTAPGMWIQKNQTVFVSLPGVPYEMQALLEQEVLPRVQKKFQRPAIVHKTLLTTGMGESAIAERIENWENRLPPDIRLAYLPSLGRVRLRLSSKGTDETALHAAINEQVNELQKIIGNHIIGVEGETSLEEVVGKLLIKRNQTLALAESCTGGMLAKQLTAVPGASAYFSGGFITYATKSKVEVLGVSETLLQEYNVVSGQIAEAMAKRAKAIYNTDYALSTTGIAGPTKGDGDAEVGTVFIGIATPAAVFSEEFHFGQPRKKVIRSATQAALELLRKEILKN